MSENATPDAAAPTPTRPGVVAPRRRRTGLIVGVAVGVVVLLALIAGGVFALNSFMKGGVSSSASDSAKVFPATTYAWFEVAIDPSPAQKLAALEMLNSMPGLQEVLEDEADFDLENADRDTDFKELLWEALEDEGALDDISLDYEDDIAPWLGARVAFGLVEGGSEEEPAVIVAIQASDVDRGVEAIETLVDEADGDDVEVSGRDGYVLISSDTIDLDDAFDDGSLAERTAFMDAADSLGEWGLMSTWYSTRGLSAEIAAIIEETFTSEGYLDAETWEDEYRTASEEFESGRSHHSLESFEDRYGFLPGEWADAAAARAAYFKDLIEAQREALDDVPDGSVVGAMRFVDASLEMTGETVGLDLPRFESADDAGAIAALPESTMAAMSFSPLGSIIDTVLSVEFLEAVPQVAQFSALGELDPSIADALPESDSVDLESGIEDARAAIDDAFAEVDLEFPDDLEALFGSSTVIAVDEDINCDEECTDPRIGLVIATDDVDETISLYEKLIDMVGEMGDAGVDVDIVDDGNRVAFATKEYSDELVDDGDRLGDDAAFARALPDLAGASMAYYFDIEEIVSALDDAFGGEDDDWVDAFDGVGAMGATISQQDDGDFAMRWRLSTES